MNNKLFLEKTELKLETSEKTLNFIYPKDYKINDPDILNGLEMKWNYKSINDEPNEFNVEIKGLTTTTINKIKLRDSVRLVAGYSEDIGEIATGIVTRKEVDKGILKLKCREVKPTFNKIISAGYAPNTKASYIVNDLASKIGFTIKQCDLKNDKVYSIGESILGSGLYEINQIVKDCSSQMTTKNDYIYIYYNELTSEKVVQVSYQSGLLEEPKPKEIQEISYKIEKTKTKKKTKKEKKKNQKQKNKSEEVKEKSDKVELQYDYEIKCLLIHQLKKGDTIELISNEIQTLCKIVEITDITDFVMNLKLLVINNGGGKSDRRVSKKYNWKNGHSNNRQNNQNRKRVR